MVMIIDIFQYYLFDVEIFLGNEKNLLLVSPVFFNKVLTNNS